jgi:serine/threonine protein kinase
LLPVPLAFTLSILRYRLWDIDFIINRSLVYGGLTALLVAVFGVSLFAAQQVIRAATGGGEIPMLGIVASAMVVGSLFQPARTKLRRLVDQRLYGIQIDYKRALHRVAARELVVQRLRDTKTSFGAYTDIQLVGRGGMGEVYRGTHPILKRSVAIKLLPMALISDETARKRFLREAQTIGRLEHANIISIQDYGEAEGMPYMVMDFVEGLSLNEYMHQRGPLPLEEAKFVLEDVASALDYAHSQGVIHRDIKPSNVMLQPITHSRALKGRLYRAVLMDFGIAKIVSDATSQLTTTGMMGTIDYIAPEQIQGAADVTRAADIYSLGVVAYEMLTGRLPFKHANPAAMLIAHLLEPAPDPRSTRPDLSDRAGSAILRALAKTPAERFNWVKPG